MLLLLYVLSFSLSAVFSPSYVDINCVVADLTAGVDKAGHRNLSTRSHDRGVPPPWHQTAVGSSNEL